ncbi:Fructosamine kinase-domain-containing protein [Xylaria palmicola]|nr:Fructosamine kinase-domain-containing protein [Xylaria palmicola]
MLIGDADPAQREARRTPHTRAAALCQSRTPMLFAAAAYVCYRYATYAVHAEEEEGQRPKREYILKTSSSTLNPAASQPASQPCDFTNFASNNFKMAASSPSSPADDDRGDSPGLDTNVVAALPSSSGRILVAPSGESLWVETVKLEAINGDDETEVFFKQSVSGETGYGMMKGAFEGESALYDFMPEYVPRPVSFGTYSTRSDLHFYICEFVDMVDEFPGPVAWAGAAASLHRRSMDRSPTGKFGFHCTTYSAFVPIDNIWHSSWEGFWTDKMKLLLSQDEELHGSDEKYSELQATFFNVVLPKYLGPLESNGRSIKPCLIHSDLSPGNMKPRAHSGAICMFNSSAYWGHHEAELGICRNPRYRLGEPYIKEYLNRMPISEPVKDFNIRNAIYALRYHVLLSLIYYKNLSYRQVDETACRTGYAPSG